MLKQRVVRGSVRIGGEHLDGVEPGLEFSELGARDAVAAGDGGCRIRWIRRLHWMSHLIEVLDEAREVGRAAVAGNRARRPIAGHDHCAPRSR